MRVKIIQCDTRDIVLQMKSRNLYYGNKNEYNINLIIKNNNNVIPHYPESEQAALSFCCLVNMMKAKLISIEYEFIKGNKEDWNFGKESAKFDPKKRDVCWLKPKIICEQLEANPEIDIICYFDTDAWIRDEELFTKFLDDFSKSSATIAAAEDLDRSSILNAGFVAVKNNKLGREIYEIINNDPIYKPFYNKIFHEQSALCEYYKKHKEEFMVLPLNDFNTPCGQIIRHAWMKDLFYKLIVDEVLALFTNIALTIDNKQEYILGNDLMAYDVSAEPGQIPTIKKMGDS